MPIYLKTADGGKTGMIRGMWYDIAGRYVELFPVRVMAQAIYHSPQSIPIWEFRDKFPSPQYNIVTNQHRWYTAEQVQAVHVLYRRIAGPTKRIEEKPRATLCEKIRAVFYNPSLKVDMDTDTVFVDGVEFQ